MLIRIMRMGFKKNMRIPAMRLVSRPAKDIHFAVRPAVHVPAGPGRKGLRVHATLSLFLKKETSCGR
jgi:hypothetical protein